MADRHAARKAEGARALGDHLDRVAPVSPRSCRWMSIPQPRRSAIAKMALSWPFGSLSTPTGSSPPIDLGACRAAWSSRSSVPGRIITPVCGKATISRSMTRDGPRASPARRQVAQLHVGADIDVRAHVRRAARHHVAQQAGALLLGRQLQLVHAPPLVLDAIDQRRAGLVRAPGHAPQRLVEMRVAIHEAGQHQAAGRSMRSVPGRPRGARRRRRCGRRGSEGRRGRAPPAGGRRG